MNVDPIESSDQRILRRLVASVPGVVWAVDPDRTTVFVSEGADRQYGLPASHFVGHKTGRFRAIVHPDDLDIFDASIAAHQGGPREHECRIIRSDGEIRWLYNSSFPVFAPDGSLQLVVGTSIDVTAQKRAERRFRDLVEQMPLAMYLALRTPDIPPIYANPQIEELTGYTPAEWLTDRPFWRIIDQRDIPATERVAAHLLESDEAIRSMYRLHRKDGRVVWVQEHSVAVPDETGEVSLVEGFLLDVTEMVEVTEELRQSESRSRAFIETAWEAIVTHAGGTIVEVQGDLAGLVGRDPDTIVGTPILSFAPESERQKLIERLQTGETGVMEVDLLKEGGGVVPVEIVSRDAEHNGLPARQVGIRDISRRKQAEAALAEAESQARHAQRLEAVGRLAGGIAHDFNNLLMAISGYADMIVDALPPGSPPREDAEEIRSTATRGAELTRQLLAFSRRQVMEQQPLSLTAVVQDSVALLERLAGEHITIQTRLDPSPAAILADHGELDQVLANLVVNARDAMPTGGEILIQTGSVIVPAGDDGSMAPGPYVTLSVADTGLGMGPETEARIFEPYFTTKEQGKGTGLGLATVYGIVSQFGGVIDVDTAPEQGTTFTISFPATDAALPSAADAATPVEQRAGDGERVLLVEDQESVRRILAKLVHDLGYAVDVVDGGEAALRLIEQEQPYSLLVTDVLMPRMDGPELVERARRLQPELPVLYVSGYTTDELLEPGGLPPRTAFLTKPFTRATLAAEIGTVIASRS